MKMHKKMLWSVGVVSAVVIGALAVSGTEAQAAPPCPPYNCALPQGQFCNTPILLNTYGPGVFCQKCGGDCVGKKYYGYLKEYECALNTPPAAEKMWVLERFSESSVGDCD